MGMISLPETYLKKSRLITLSLINSANSNSTIPIFFTSELFASFRFSEKRVMHKFLVKFLKNLIFFFYFNIFIKYLVKNEKKNILHFGFWENCWLLFDPRWKNRKAWFYSKECIASCPFGKCCSCPICIWFVGLKSCIQGNNSNFCWCFLGYP